jgi:hypothetical protein
MNSATQSGQSTAGDTSDITEVDYRTWVRLTRNIVRCSERVEMALITAGGVTDPEYYVQAVNEFYVYLRSYSTALRVGHGWRFRDTETAKTAYAMLCRIVTL